MYIARYRDTLSLNENSIVQKYPSYIGKREISIGDVIFARCANAIIRLIVISREVQAAIVVGWSSTDRQNR